MRSVTYLVLTLLAASVAPAEEPRRSASEEASLLLSADVETAWAAARALVTRPGSENRAVRLALSEVVEEAGLSVDVPGTLRRTDRGAIVDRVRQAALLARLAKAGVAVPPGMVAVPGGRSARPLTEEETPVADFLIDRLETSRDAFAAYLKATGRTVALEGWADGRPPPGTGALPVTHVDRAEAAAFAAWRGARLATAEEWRLAREGSSGATYPWGGSPKKGLANVLDGGGTGRAEPVDGRPEGASSLGVLRLAGNVSEWTSSPWGPSEAYGVAAGETFLSVPQFATVVVRKTRVTTRRRDLGFRCAASIPTR